MNHLSALSQWIDRLTSQMPSLSQPQARMLAYWSFAAVVCCRCGLSTVADFLARLLDRNQNNIQQQLRDVYRAKQDKAGSRRSELDLTAFRKELLAWLVGEAQRVVLILDPTTLSDRFTVLAVSVACEGGAVPVAWQVTYANEPGEWNPIWKRLLEDLQKGLPETAQVLVLTDRGLESPTLFQDIQALGFHPVMRIKQGAKFRPQGWKKFHLVETLGKLGGFRSAGTLYKKRSPLDCQLLIHQEQGQEEAWFVATDCDQVQAVWYAFRSWIEKGFKDLKRGGLQWQNTQVKDSTRVQRYWCVLALCFVQMLEVGGALELLAPPGQRHLSRWREGQLYLLVCLIKGTQVPRRPISQLLQSMVYPQHPVPKPYTEQDFEDH